MPDNRVLLKESLGELGLAPQRKEEILRELNEHLADHAAALEALGVTPDAAAREALDSVSNWPEFRNEILSAETEEANMNYRTKVLWLPALGALTLSSTLLALFQFSGLVPRFYWLNGIGGFPFYTIYLPWLIALPVVGTVAAYWSQRAGGKVSHRLLAALAPPIGLLSFILIVSFLSLPIVLFVSLRHPGHGHSHAALGVYLTGFWTLLVSWMLLPGIALFLGTAPFLRRSQAKPQEV